MTDMIIELLGIGCLLIATVSAYLYGCAVMQSDDECDSEDFQANVGVLCAVSFIAGVALVVMS